MENNVAGLPVPLMASGTLFALCFENVRVRWGQGSVGKVLAVWAQGPDPQKHVLNKKVRHSSALVISAPRRLGQRVSGVCWTDPQSRHSAGEPVSKKQCREWPRKMYPRLTSTPYTYVPHGYTRMHTQNVRDIVFSTEQWSLSSE